MLGVLSIVLGSYIFIGVTESMGSGKQDNQGWQSLQFRMIEENRYKLRAGNQEIVLKLQEGWDHAGVVGMVESDLLPKAGSGSYSYTITTVADERSLHGGDQR